jgi:hypothetical protein
METAPAIRLRFLPGKVQIFVDDVLRLEAPWNGPEATLETDQRLKQWASNLQSDSPDSNAIDGISSLVAAGFKQDDDGIWRRSGPRIGDVVIFSNGAEVKIHSIEQTLALHGHSGAIPIQNLVSATDKGRGYWRVDPSL